jgi:uncharacterized protein
MDERLQRGADEFNAGDFFTAHETWEELWDETVGPQKLLLQGLVQIAAGYAKVETGVRRGAIKLLTRGIELLRQSGGSAGAWEVEAFIAGVAADLERLRTTNDAALDIDHLRVPRLRLA